MKLLNTFFLIFMFGFCAAYSYQSPIHVQLTEKIVEEFSNEMKTKYKLIQYGFGGGFMDNVNKISIDYFTVGLKSQDELRELIIELTENFLKRINSNQEIRKYLIEYPFPVKNLDFSIGIVNKDMKRIKNKGDTHELLSDVVVRNGTVRYQFTNEDKPYLQTLYKEPYEEALKIVQKQRKRY